mgnify:CR=1 FL=1
MAKAKKKRKCMTKQEKEDWDALYNFVKEKILMYDENQSLSRTMVLRLKGLLSNKFIENSNIEDSANYSYRTILTTFKFCIVDIQKGLRNHSFSDEMHKFNYILKIIENNINTVYLRMQQAEKAKNKTEKMDTSIVTHTGAEYQRKTKDVSNKFDNLW